jgi:hypothetical protein
MEDAIDGDSIPDRSIARRWQALEEFAGTWARRVAAGSVPDDPQASWLERSIALTRTTLDLVKGLREKARDDQALRDITSVLEHYIEESSRWWHEPGETAFYHARVSPASGLADSVRHDSIDTGCLVERLRQIDGFFQAWYRSPVRTEIPDLERDVGGGREITSRELPAGIEAAESSDIQEPSTVPAPPFSVRDTPIETKTDFFRCLSQVRAFADQVARERPGGLYAIVARQLAAVAVWTAENRVPSRIERTVVSTGNLAKHELASSSDPADQFLCAVLPVIQDRYARWPEDPESVADDAPAFDATTPSGPGGAVEAQSFIARLRRRARSLARAPTGSPSRAASDVYGRAIESWCDGLLEILGHPLSHHSERMCRDWLGGLQQFLDFQETHGTGPRPALKRLRELAKEVEAGLRGSVWAYAPAFPRWARACDPVLGVTIESFEQCYVLLHALEESDLGFDQEDLGCALEHRVRALRKACDRWFETGDLSQDLKEKSVDTDRIPDEATRHRWQAVQAFVSTWTTRSPEDVPAPSLESVIRDCQRTECDLEGLQRSGRVCDAASTIRNHLQAYLRPATWFGSAYDLPIVTRTGQSCADVARKAFGVGLFPRSGELLSGMHELMDRFEAGPVTKDREFTYRLLDLAITCRILAHQSNCPSMHRIDHLLLPLTHKLTDEFPLDDSLFPRKDFNKQFQRHLAIYEAIDVPRMLDRLAAIVAFHRAWQPPAVVFDRDQIAPAAGEETESRAPAAESNEDPASSPIVANAMEWRRFEFLWNVESACRSFSGLLEDARVRAVGVQLRALHRWMAGGARPGAECLEATAAFFSHPDIRRLAASPGRRSRSIEEAYAINAYLRAWPGESGRVLDSRERSVAYPPSMESEEHVQLVLRYAVDDVAALLAGAPEREDLAGLLEHLLRVQQVYVLGRETSPGEVDQMASSLERASFEGENPFPGVPDFNESLTTRLHELAGVIRQVAGST